MLGWVDLGGLVTYRGGIPVRRRSPFPLLTGLKVGQLRSCDERRYGLAMHQPCGCKTQYVLWDTCHCIPGSHKEKFCRWKAFVLGWGRQAYKWQESLPMHHLLIRSTGSFCTKHKAANTVTISLNGLIRWQPEINMKVNKQIEYWPAI